MSDITRTRDGYAIVGSVEFALQDRDAFLIQLDEDGERIHSSLALDSFATDFFPYVAELASGDLVITTFSDLSTIIWCYSPDGSQRWEVEFSIKGG